MSADKHAASTQATWTLLQKMKICGVRPPRIYAMQEIESMSKPMIEKVTTFKTPDGLEFTEYQLALKHSTKRRLVVWLETLKWEDFKSLDDLADALRRDWHISYRTKEGKTDGEIRVDEGSGFSNVCLDSRSSETGDSPTQGAAAAVVRADEQGESTSEGEARKGSAQEKPLRKYWARVSGKANHVMIRGYPERRPFANPQNWFLVVARDRNHAREIVRTMVKPR